MATSNSDVTSRSVTESGKPLSVSFADLISVPHRERPIAKRPRAKPPKFEMTSAATMEFVESRASKKSVSLMPKSKTIKKKKKSADESQNIKSKPITSRRNRGEPNEFGPIAKRPRAKLPKFEMTSAATMEFVESRSSKKSVSLMPKSKTIKKKKSADESQNIKSKPITSRRNRGEPNKTKFSRSRTQQKKVSAATSSKDVCTSDKRYYCLVCGEDYDESWIQCRKCKNWAHEDCAYLTDKDFYDCDICSRPNR